MRPGRVAAAGPAGERRGSDAMSPVAGILGLPGAEERESARRGFPLDESNQWAVGSPAVASGSLAVKPPAGTRR